MRVLERAATDDYDRLRAQVFDRHQPGLSGAEHEAFIAHATRRRDEAAVYEAIRRRGKLAASRRVEQRHEIVEVNPATGERSTRIVTTATYPDGQPKEQVRIVDVPPGTTSAPRKRTAKEERHTAVLMADDELRALAWEAGGSGTLARLARQQLAERRAELGLAPSPAA